MKLIIVLIFTSALLIVSVCDYEYDSSKNNTHGQKQIEGSVLKYKTS